MAKRAEAKKEVGWWVPLAEFDRQAVFPLRGSWQLVRDRAGREHRAMQLSTRPGWNNTNFDPVPDVVEWFKPADKFKSAVDVKGKK